MSSPSCNRDIHCVFIQSANIEDVARSHVALCACMYSHAPAYTPTLTPSLPCESLPCGVFGSWTGMKNVKFQP